MQIIWHLLFVSLTVLGALATNLGNHQYHVVCPHAAAQSDAAWVRLPWRRQAAPDPRNTTCVVVSSSGQAIANRIDSVGRAGLDPFDAGDVAFQPDSSAMNYTLHCFPYDSTGSATGVSYRAHYLPPYQGADAAWREANNLTESGLDSGAYRTTLPQCIYNGYSSRTPFDAFSDTALVATTAEMKELSSLQSNLVLFAGDRRAPLKTFGNRPPAGWILNRTRLYPNGQTSEIFEPHAAPGESVALQVGVWVGGEASMQLRDQDVVLAPLVPQGTVTTDHGDRLSQSGCPTAASTRRGPGTATHLPSHGSLHSPSQGVHTQQAEAALTSIGTRGYTDSGEPLSQALTFRSQRAGAVWMLARMPEDAQTGVWCGSASLTFRPVAAGNNGAAGSAAVGDPVTVTVPIAVNVTERSPIPEGGAVDTWRLSRAGWLDSQLGLEDSVTRRYAPVEVSSQGSTVAQMTGAGVRLATSESVVVLKGGGTNQRATGEATGFTVGITGREIAVNASGESLFSSTSANGPSGQPGDLQQVLGPVSVQATRGDGSTVAWSGKGAAVTSAPTAVSTASWSTSKASQRGDLWVRSNVTAWFDGFVEIDFAVGATGAAPVPLQEVSLPLDLSEGACSLVMGLGQQGQSVGVLANSTANGSALIDWEWGDHVNEGSNQVWVGSAWGGVRAKLKGQGHGSNYGWESPLHQYELTDVPNSSWAGEGMRGGIRFSLQDKHSPLRSRSNELGHYGGRASSPTAAQKKWLESPGACQVLLRSGKVVAAPGDGTAFKLDLMLTPVRPLDGEEWRRHFADRYYLYGYHGELTPPKVAQFNTTVFDTHQGQVQNPYINYLFREDTVGILRNWTDLARQSGMIASEVYYTTRELSNRAYEQWILWAIQSAGGDAFYVETPEDELPTASRGNAWLQEHLGSVPYTPAWQTDLPWMDAQDAALHNSGQSRWNNFYLQGLNFAIASPLGPRTNGVYIDETAFSRLTATRMRRAEEASALTQLADSQGLAAEESGRLQQQEARQIVRNNLHSCNKFVCRTGDSQSTVLRASSALIYAAHLPTFDRLWFGEGFSGAYKTGQPDYWLAEMSGVPFGLTASMLDMPAQALYRGMAAGLEDNRPATCVWPVWVDLGLDQGGADVYGWWNASVPVSVASVNGEEGLASEVLASVAVRRAGSGSEISAEDGVALVAVANFASGALAKGALQVVMQIDWQALFGAQDVGVASQPNVCGFQGAEQLPLGPNGTLSITIGPLESNTNGRLIELRPSQ